MMVSKLLLTFKEAAELLGVPLPTLHRWTSKGKLHKVDGTSYIARSEIERFALIRAEPRSAEQRRRGRYNIRNVYRVRAPSEKDRT